MTRLDRLEPERAGRPHIIWTDGLTEVEIEQEISQRAADGTLCELDELLLIRWKTHEEHLAELEAANAVGGK